MLRKGSVSNCFFLTFLLCCSPAGHDTLNLMSNCKQTWYILPTAGILLLHERISKCVSTNHSITSVIQAKGCVTGFKSPWMMLLRCKRTRPDKMSAAYLRSTFISVTGPSFSSSRTFLLQYNCKLVTEKYKNREISPYTSILTQVLTWLVTTSVFTQEGWFTDTSHLHT